MRKLKVLVTCPPMLGMKDTFIPKLEKLGMEVHCPDVVQTLSEDELVDLVPQFDGWIIGDDPASRKVFEAGSAGRLKSVVKWGIGVDNVDFNACSDLNIPVSNTPNMFGAEVADIAMNYVIGLARDTFFIDRQVRSNLWPKPRGISLAGKTIGLVGFGDIGKNFLTRARAADMSINIYDPAFLNSENDSDGFVNFFEWPTKINECDFLVFTCSLNNNNVHMLDSEILKQCKKGVRIVNVARGPLIDESALVSALKDGTVHSVALDVFEIEPLPSKSPLRTMDKCIFGSHNGSNTSDAVLATNEKAINQLLQHL